MASDSSSNLSQIAPLMFGIPQLDALMGYSQTADNPTDDFYATLRNATSLTIVGEDGTGKSVFALHLAAAYASLHYRGLVDQAPFSIPQKCPVIVYASSDLRYSAAVTVWDNFYLDHPWLRYVPSISKKEQAFRRSEFKRLEKGEHLKVELVPCKPTEVVARATADAINRSDGTKYPTFFIDLATESTGDDWRYISSLLAAIPRRAGGDGGDSLLEGQPPNLLIVDSVAGFETLVGRRNTFGDEASRRSRVSQLLKAAGESWHVVFVAEEPDGLKHHPEEYVTDTVIHLRRVGSQERVRRHLEIEKSRARDFAQGEHPFEIRGGRGTSTRSWENPDDPQTLLHPDVYKQLVKPESGRQDYSAYIQVFPSLHYLSKHFGSQHLLKSFESDEKSAKPRIPFGIEYLDNVFRPSPSKEKGGLYPSTITALIGEEGTRKVYLAEEFLIAAYEDFPAILGLFLEISKEYLISSRTVDFCKFVQTTGVKILNKRDDIASKVNLLKRLETFGNRLYVQSRIDSVARHNYPLRDPHVAPLKTRWSLMEYLDDNNEAQSATTSGTDSSRVEVAPEALLALAFSAMRLPTGVLPPTVFVTTHDSSCEALVERIFRRQSHDLTRMIHRHVGEGFADTKKHLHYLRRVLESWITVRRVELVDTTSPQLWHVIEGAVVQGINHLGYQLSDIRGDTEPQVGAEQVRIVISDLRLLRDTYPAVAGDPLFLPTLVFRLKRFGVTTLIVESDNGRLDQPPSHPMSGVLRSLVDHQINTWKINFFGEQRVAIVVLPSARTSNACLIRELRFDQTKTGDGANELIVDPLFEIFENIDEGKPSAVKLQIQIYNETPAFQKYVDSEKGALQLIFSPESQDVSEVLCISPPSDYKSWRDYTHLPASRKLPFTLVFMVDGFWALGRANGLRNEHDYLFNTLPASNSLVRFEDHFKLFMEMAGPEATADTIRCRADFFHQEMPPARDIEGYHHRIKADFNDIDRVPFMWDFGFLLCDLGQWQRAGESLLSGKRKTGKDDGPTIDSIFQRLLIPRQIRQHVLGSERVATETSPSHRSASEPVVSWREFLGACKIVAGKEEKRIGKPCRIFDAVSTSPDSLVCMMLEIWLSEVFRDLLSFDRFLREAGASLAESLSKSMNEWIGSARSLILAVSSRSYEQSHKFRMQDLLKSNAENGADIKSRIRSWQTHFGLIDKDGKAADNWSPEFRSRVQRFCVIQATGGYTLHLYQTWLLLLEVLDFSSFVSENAPIDFLHDRPRAAASAATRHWYKTACAVANPESGIANALEQPFQTKVPARLPGHFSARGDWFLAVSDGSRSGRLADQAIDLLSSRRANRARLQMGLGLPVRDIVPGAEIGKIRTGLQVGTPTEILGVNYESILEMGGSFFPEGKDNINLDRGGFFWLFRSGLENYDKQAVATSRWLHKMFTWTIEYRFRHSAMWVGGFSAYDDLVEGNTAEVEHFDSWKEFFAYLRVFEADLKACG